MCLVPKSEQQTKDKDFHKLKPIPLMQNFDHWGIYFIGPFVLEKKKTLSICNYGHRSIHEVSRRSGYWIDNCVRSYKFSFEKILCHYGCLVHTSFDPGAHFFANTYKWLIKYLRLLIRRLFHTTLAKMS